MVICFRQQWKWDLSLSQNRASNVLVGVGWKSYSKKFNMLGKLLLKSRLSSPYFHSVRDEFTKKVLAELGGERHKYWMPNNMDFRQKALFNNSNKKADCVLLTLTDYNTCDKNQILLDILLKRYCRCFSGHRALGIWNNYIKSWCRKSHIDRTFIKSSR